MASRDILRMLCLRAERATAAVEKSLFGPARRVTSGQTVVSRCFKEVPWHKH